MDGELNELDRISILPENLRYYILSLLNLKQAVQMSVLSRRWRGAWTCMRTLNFDYNSYKLDDDRSHGNASLRAKSFKHFVLRVLAEYDGFYLRELSFSSSYAEKQIHLLELLICYAGCNSVYELSIKIEGINWFNWQRCLPVCKHLKALSLSCPFKLFEVDLGVSMLPQLKILEIESSWGESLNHKDMFSGFPQLESLVLVNFLRAGSTSICAPKLVNFEVCATSDTAWEVFFPEFELLTPNLMYIGFVNILPSVKVKSALDLPCLEKVEIGIHENNITNHGQDLRENLAKLFNVFHNAKSITMPLNAIEILLSVHSSISEDLSFRNLKHLILETKRSRKKINLPINLLECFMLETLEVDFNHQLNLDDDDLVPLVKKDRAQRELVQQFKQHAQLQQQAIQLIQHSEQLNQHAIQLNQHAQQLDQHVKQLNDHAKQLNQHAIQLYDDAQQLFDDAAQLFLPQT